MRITFRVTDLNPAHVRLSIWVNGGLICDPGGICLRVDELLPFVDRVKPERIECGAGIEEAEVKKHLRGVIRVTP